jgi:hypothetical protein
MSTNPTSASPVTFLGRPPAAPAPPRLDPAAAREVLASVASALLDERRQLTGDELRAASAVPDESVPSLAALAHEVRLAWCGPMVEVEGILSAKTGGCPEDCHFCAQSAQFETPVKATPFLDTDEVLGAARETAELGASEFCIVLAVRGPDERTMARLIELVPLVREETGLEVAVSAGILTDEQARRLAAAGVHRYNHNLETARSFFGQVVTTHSWEERRDTCALVRTHGMELCCGALLGMGETEEQRIELLLELREAGDAAGRPGDHPGARGHPLDRPLPPRAPGRHPPLRRRAGGDAARPAGDGDDRRHQRADRGQLPHHPRALSGRGPSHAGRPEDARRRPRQGPVSEARAS